MKYVVFAAAVLGIPPFAHLMGVDRRWFRLVFWIVAFAMCFYIKTSLNFYSREEYRGSARGIEVSLVHLVSIAAIWAAALRAGALKRKFPGFLPDGGYRFYVLYFLLCLPSLRIAASGLYASFEVWKMAMLFLFYVGLHACLVSTDDVKTALRALAESPGGIQTYNLGTGRGASVLELVRAFEAANGVPVKHEFVPRRPGDIAVSFADCSKAERELGWHAQFGLAEICRDAWRRETGRGAGSPGF